MSEEPARDREPRALPPSELPSYAPTPDADEYDQASEGHARYPWSESFEDDYHQSAPGEADDGNWSEAPLIVPTEAPDSDRGFRRNGYGDYRSHAESAAFDGSSDWADYQQAQASEDGYQPSAQADQRTMKFSLWGSPASGKTTFLAVLRHAAEGKDGGKAKGRHKEKDGIGHWSIYPMNQISARLMTHFTRELSQGGFPSATLPGEKIPLQWLFDGDITHSKFTGKRHWGGLKGRVESRFMLDLVDVSGHVFAHDPSQVNVPESIASEALQRLIEADGIIYLFDPIGERDNRNSFDYVNRTIGELMLRASPGRQGSARKQQIAVCVTKFDDPAVFQAARRSGFVSFDANGVPRVPDEHAEEFYDLFCTDSFWQKRYEQSARSATYIRNGLNQAFGSANITYYVTSSIGFYRPSGWQAGGSRFDPNDFTNVIPGAGGRSRIRGLVNPINVLEPLVGLHRRLV